MAGGMSADRVQNLKLHLFATRGQFGVCGGPQQQGKFERGGGLERAQAAEPDGVPEQVYAGCRIGHPLDGRGGHKVDDKTHFGIGCRGDADDAKPANLEFAGDGGWRAGDEASVDSCQHGLVVGDKCAGAMAVGPGAGQEAQGEVGLT